MYFSDDSEIVIGNSNYNNSSTSKPEQNHQSIINLLPRRFREKSANSRLALARAPNRGRVTIGTTYSDLSSSRLFGHYEHLLDRLLTRTIRKPNRAIPKKSSSLRVDNAKLMNGSNLEIEKKSLLRNNPSSYSSQFVCGNVSCDSSALGNHDPEASEYSVQVRYRPTDNEMGKFAIDEQPRDLGGRAYYSSSHRTRCVTDKFSSALDSDIHRPSDGSNDEIAEIEDDSQKIHFRSKNISRQNSYFSGRNSEKFNDEFLSPFEFNVESRRNYIADEFTPMSNHLREIHSPHQPSSSTLENHDDNQIDGEFLNPFEFEDHIQRRKGTSVDDDFISRNHSKYISRVGADGTFRNCYPEDSSISRNYNSEVEGEFRHDSIFDPVRDQYQDDSNSFHLRFSSTTYAHVNENIFNEHRALSETMSSPSVIEATPYQNAGKEYPPENDEVSCMLPRTTLVDTIIEDDGDEVYFRDSKECKSITNYEDVDDGIDVSTPISSKQTPEFVPVISYLQNGKLIMEENENQLLD